MCRAMDPFQKSHYFVIEEVKKKGRAGRESRREGGRQGRINETVTLGILPLNKN